MVDLTIDVFVDGACEPVNPGGIATYGFAIYRGGEKIAEGSGVVEGRDTSNNVAEYSAAIEAFRWLLGSRLIDAEELVVLRSDSELLINQLKGLYAVRAKRVQPLYEELTRMIRDLKRRGKPLRIRFEWIPRERNEEADTLSRQAYEDFCAKNPDALECFAGYLASEKQKEFMRRLAISIPVGLSKRAASRLISERLKELDSKRK